MLLSGFYSSSARLRKSIDQFNSVTLISSGGFNKQAAQLGARAIFADNYWWTGGSNQPTYKIPADSNTPTALSTISSSPIILGYADHCLIGIIINNVSTTTYTITFNAYDIETLSIVKTATTSSFSTSSKAYPVEVYHAQYCGNLAKTAIANQYTTLIQSNSVFVEIGKITFTFTKSSGFSEISYTTQRFDTAQLSSKVYPSGAIGNGNITPIQVASGCSGSTKVYAIQGSSYKVLEGVEVSSYPPSTPWCDDNYIYITCTTSTSASGYLRFFRTSKTAPSLTFTVVDKPSWTYQSTNTPECLTGFNYDGQYYYGLIHQGSGVGIYRSSDFSTWTKMPPTFHATNDNIYTISYPGERGFYE